MLLVQHVCPTQFLQKSKIMLDDINVKMQFVTQCYNTAAVISWYKNVEDKAVGNFLCMITPIFFLSIMENLFVSY